MSMDHLVVECSEPADKHTKDAMHAADTNAALSGGHCCHWSETDSATVAAKSTSIYPFAHCSQHNGNSVLCIMTAFCTLLVSLCILSRVQHLRSRQLGLLEPVQATARVRKGAAQQQLLADCRRPVDARHCLQALIVELDLSQSSILQLQCCSPPESSRRRQADSYCGLRAHERHTDSLLSHSRRSCHILSSAAQGVHTACLVLVKLAACSEGLRQSLASLRRGYNYHGILPNGESACCSAAAVHTDRCRPQHWR